MSFGQSVYVHIIRETLALLRKTLVDILLRVHVFISGLVVSVLECLLPALSNKSTSHVLHIFTVTSPPQQQCFRFVQVRVLASA